MESKLLNKIKEQFYMQKMKLSEVQIQCCGQVCNIFYFFSQIIDNLYYLHILFLSISFWTVINTLYILNFDRKYKFSNKNNTVSAWVNFKNIFPRPLFIIIFRPEMLKFHQCSILTGDTRFEFVIYCVLRTP